MADKKHQYADEAETIMKPPPDLLPIVETTANYVARKGALFEEQILNRQTKNRRFNFLRPSSPYYAFYRNKIKEIKAGDSTPAKTEEEELKDDAAKKEEEAELAKFQAELVPSGHSQTKCVVEKCDEYVFKDHSGNEHLFCTKRCRNKMNDLAAKQGGAVLFEMKPDNAKYQTVTTQIEKAWEKTAVEIFDNVDSIYSVYNPTRWQKYNDYRKTLDEKYKADLAKPGWKDRVNQQRRFHITYCYCELKTNEPCAEIGGGCRICGIVTKGFDFDFGRFGYGVYLTDVSEKAHDYTGKSMSHTSRGGNRWILLCLVALGQVETMQNGDPNLLVPPNSADSVEGLTNAEDPTDALNLKEWVVYNEDAVYPCYIINYKYKAGQ